MEIDRLGHVLQVQAALERALLALTDAGVEALVWKGAALVGPVYALDERYMADADVIVREPERAHAALRAAGFSPVPGDAGLVRTRRSWGWCPTGGGALLDLHIAVGLAPLTRVALGPLFGRAVAMPVGRAVALRPCNVDLLLLVAVDQLMDDFAYKAHPDMARIVEALPLDWPTVAERARRWGCATALWLGLRHAGVAVPAGVMSQLAPSAPRGALLTRGLGLDTTPLRWPSGLRARQAIHHLAAADNPLDAIAAGARWLRWRYGGT